MRGLVRGDPRGPETREMLRARGRATRFQPAREGERFGRFREMARAERPSGEIEDGRQVDVDSGARRGPCRSPFPAASASFGLWNDEAGAPGGSSSKVLALPPSWSTKTSARRGRGSRRLQSWTITPATPLGAGRPETTTRAAFCLGVSDGRSVGWWLPPETSSECGLEQRGETHAT